MRSKILIVAAHSDDEVLGCGGTIAKLAMLGHKVGVVFMTNGVSSSRLMQLANFLKVPITYFYEDFPSYKVDGSTDFNNTDLNYSFLVKTFSKLSDTDKNKLIQLLRNSSNLKETG